MELKVWVEGIQRVVCGVNEKTTCQDVVYALAHATGKTGRFTLIERWRSSERLLAPGEQPLKVLLKWGEHSNDVQFILQWSPLDSSTTSAKQTSPGKSGQSTGSSSNNNNIGSGGENSNEGFPASQNSGKSYSPASHPSNNGLSSSKKLPYSTTPSSYHLPTGAMSSSSNQGRSPGLSHSNNNNGSGVKPLSHVNGDPVLGSRLAASEASTSGALKGAPQRLIHSDAIKDFPPSPVGSSGKGSNSPSGNAKMKELSAPPPYREPPNPILYQGKVSPSISSPTGMNSSSLKGLPPYREPPPPTMLQQQQPQTSSSMQQQQSQYANTYQLRHSASSLPSATTKPVSNSQSFFNSSANSSSSSLQNSSGLGTAPSNVTASGVPPSKESPRHLHGHSSHDNFSSSYTNTQNEKSDNFPFWNMKDPQVVNGSLPNANLNGSVNTKSSSNVCITADSPNSHYKELVRLVNSQREKLTSQQAELTQYDAEIMFWEGKAKEQQRNMEFITKEISRLEQISSQNESQVLSLAHLEEENEYVRQESESLKSELTFLRNELGKCENELDKYRSRLRRLIDELHSTQDAVSKRQEEWLQREVATLAEVERLKKELELARRETDAVSDLSGSLDKEVHSLESTLAEKKKQLEQLVSAMKEANLQSLIINPPEEIVDGGVHQRSGSTRRMIGSPRQLENAAPTSKNPHGVWV